MGGRRSDCSRAGRHAAGRNDGAAQPNHRSAAPTAASGTPLFFRSCATAGRRCEQRSPVEPRVSNASPRADGGVFTGIRPPDAAVAADAGLDAVRRAVHQRVRQLLAGISSAVPDDARCERHASRTGGELLRCRPARRPCPRWSSALRSSRRWRRRRRARCRSSDGRPRPGGTACAGVRRATSRGELVGEMVSDPVAQTYATELASPELRACYQAAFASAVNAGYLLARLSQAGCTHPPRKCCGCSAWRWASPRLDSSSPVSRGDRRLEHKAGTCLAGHRVATTHLSGTETP